MAPLLLDTEGVEIAGRVSEEEKWRLLGEADLLCAPSLGGESFGMVLTEAFASGTPVVASNIAGYRDVVRNRLDGLLVPAGDAVELGETLRDLALDPAGAQCMARSARERAERFAWPQVAREVTEVYEEALDQPAARGPRGQGRRAGRHAARGAGRPHPAHPAALARAEGVPPTGPRRLARIARRALVGVGAVGWVRQPQHQHLRGESGDVAAAQVHRGNHQSPHQVFCPIERAQLGTSRSSRPGGRSRSTACTTACAPARWLGAQDTAHAHVERRERFDRIHAITASASISISISGR